MSGNGKLNKGPGAKVKAEAALLSAKASLLAGDTAKDKALHLIDECQDVLARALDKKVRNISLPSH